MLLKTAADCKEPKFSQKTIANKLWYFHTLEHATTPTPPPTKKNNDVNK